MKKIAILGHFGGNEEFLDGQTVKTKILYDELSAQTEWNIQKLDTYWKNKKPIRLVISTLWALILRKDIIVLLSISGMKTFFPILSFFSRHWNVRVFHDVIGGNLDKYVAKYPKFRGYLNSFTENWVETETLKKGLEKGGVHNCEVVPNFKRLTITKLEESPKPCGEPYRFCTFSRVMKEKGIETAINAVEQINNDNGRQLCTLDIYGVVDRTYQDDFDRIMSKSTDAIHYCGVVPYNESVETIKDYFALLFPTFWDGEGFPGTIVDAFSAGLPVIASDWNSNGEIVNDGKNGILYPGNIAESLKQAMVYLIENSEQMMALKKQCIADAQKYQPELHVKRLIKILERTR